MPLTEEQAFKVGFLKRCAEEGLTIAETKARVKLALYLARQMNEKRAGLGSVLGTIAVATPIIGGGLGGYYLAKVQSGSGSDSDPVEEAKKDEIIGEYERLADQARRRARLKLLQAATGNRVVALTS